ncbi:MAG: thioredoxin-dependent thiol peroxidase [Bacteroidota bacterium]
MKPEPGQKAPAFTATDQDGKTHSLKDYKGKKVVLFFYPQDDTETCTKEACNLRDNYHELTQRDIVVLGVSPDDEKSHKKFEKKYSLPFTLLADTNQKILKAYGVWDWKTFMGRTYIGVHRTTFLINEKGKVDHVIEKVVSKTHAEQILETWGLK